MQKVLFGGSSLALFFASVLCFVLHALIRMTITGLIFFNAGDFLIPLGYGFFTLSVISFVAFLFSNAFDSTTLRWVYITEGQTSVCLNLDFQNTKERWFHAILSIYWYTDYLNKVIGFFVHSREIIFWEIKKMSAVLVSTALKVVGKYILERGWIILIRFPTTRWSHLFCCWADFSFSAHERY